MTIPRCPFKVWLTSFLFFHFLLEIGAYLSTTLHHPFVPLSAPIEARTATITTLSFEYSGCSRPVDSTKGKFVSSPKPACATIFPFLKNQSGFRLGQFSETELAKEKIEEETLCVAVVGATGGIGQLVTARLLEEGKRAGREDLNVGGKYKVIAIGKDETKLTSLYDGERQDQDDEESNSMNKLLSISTADTKDLPTLYEPLREADIVIIATGTSAFPSPRWFPSKNGPGDPNVYNTPDNVDRKGVKNILKAITFINKKRNETVKGKVKMVVFLSSVGVTRTQSFPYAILNAFGVLDAKRDAEIAIKDLSKEEGFDYMILRPGRLVGGPWTNTDVARLLKTEEGNRKRIEASVGDEFNGDAARWSVAEFVVRGVKKWRKGGKEPTTLNFMNKEINLVNKEGEIQNDLEWDRIFGSL